MNRLAQEVEQLRKDYADLKQWWDMNPHLMQHGIHAQTKRAEAAESALKEAVDAIRSLYDHQNGCPLPKYEKGWREAMEKCRKFLYAHEPSWQQDAATVLNRLAEHDARSVKEGKLAGLRYALSLVESRRVLNRNASYLAACEEMEVFLKASIERVECGYTMHSESVCTAPECNDPKPQPPYGQGHESKE